MSSIEITSKIEELKALTDLIEEAKAEAEALTDSIKAEMLSRGTEELQAGQYIVRWTSLSFLIGLTLQHLRRSCQRSTKPIQNRFPAVDSALLNKSIRGIASQQNGLFPPIIGGITYENVLFRSISRGNGVNFRGSSI